MKPSGGHLKTLSFVVVIFALIISARAFDLPARFRVALEWIASLGWWGPLIFIGLYVVACVLLLPGSVLTLGAGAVFGLARGSIIVSLAATLGATAAFLVGRYLARAWMTKKIAGNPRFQAIDEGVAREGWKIVLLARLSPVFPFNLLNYAFGLTRVSLRHYVLASWVGMIPGTLLFVYLGSLAGDLAQLGTGSRARTPAEWALYGLGLLATVLVTIFITRIARRALAKRGG